MTITIPRPSKAAVLLVAVCALPFAVHQFAPGQAARFVGAGQAQVLTGIETSQFSGVAEAFTSYYQVAGSYEGAEVSGQQLSTRWTTASAYCVEISGGAGEVRHLLGPNGQIAPGRCP
jgi:hypothetical protein